MNAKNKTTLGQIVAVLITATALFCGAALLAATVGCDDYSDVILDSYDYQQSVFDAANDAWTDYIRM